MADTLQTGKTRWCHYQTAYHFVWIPKYRRRVLTGEVQVGAKAAIEACCVQHGFTLLALETDEDHVHCFVAGAPAVGAGDDCRVAEGLLLATAPGAVSGAEKALWKGVALDQRLLRRITAALHYGVSREVACSQARPQHRFWAAQLAALTDSCPRQQLAFIPTP